MSLSSLKVCKERMESLGQDIYLECGKWRRREREKEKGREREREREVQRVSSSLLGVVWEGSTILEG